MRLPLSAIIGLVLTGSFVFIAVFAQWLAPYDIGSTVGGVWDGPSATHWLGTDTIGRDIFSRLIYGAQITPLISASSHVVAEERRTRKLLLHRDEIDNLIGRVQRDGYTIVPTALYWKANKVKAEIALAKGKQTHDKRATSKDRDWAIEKQRVMRRHNKNA